MAEVETTRDGAVLTITLNRPEVFNAFNADYWSAVASTQWAATSYLQPSVVLQGRIIRASIDVKW